MSQVILQINMKANIPVAELEQAWLEAAQLVADTPANKHRPAAVFTAALGFVVLYLGQRAGRLELPGHRLDDAAVEVARIGIIAGDLNLIVADFLVLIVPDAFRHLAVGRIEKVNSVFHFFVPAINNTRWIPVVDHFIFIYCGEDLAGGYLGICERITIACAPFNGLGAVLFVVEKSDFHRDLVV